jgi:hypothetical protein
LNNLANVVIAQGDLDRAAALHQEALGYQRDLRNKQGIAMALGGLGWVAYLSGEHNRAAALHRQSLLFAREHGARENLADFLEGLVAATGMLGQSRLAAQLGGASSAVRDAFGGYISHKEYESAMRTVRMALGEKAFAVAWAEGRALSPDAALALALAPDAATGEGPYGVVGSGSDTQAPTEKDALG